MIAGLENQRLFQFQNLMWSWEVKINQSSLTFLLQLMWILLQHNDSAYNHNTHCWSWKQHSQPIFLPRHRLFRHPMASHTLHRSALYCLLVYHDAAHKNKNKKTRVKQCDTKTSILQWFNVLATCKGYLKDSCLLVGCLMSQHAVTLRQKLQIKLSTSPSHSILTPGQPVPGLTL